MKKINIFLIIVLLFAGLWAGNRLTHYYFIMDEESTDQQKDELIEMQARVITLALLNSTMVDQINALLPPQSKRTKFKDFGIDSSESIPTSGQYFNEAKKAKLNKKKNSLEAIEKEMEKDFKQIYTVLLILQNEKQL